MIKKQGITMDNLKLSFYQIYGYKENLKVYFSPGRVNLIGEYIDFNGGLVFPAAINLGTYGVVAKRDDKTIRLYSKNYHEQGIITSQLDKLIFDESHGWANYAIGILSYLKIQGNDIPYGFDLLVSGDLPTASGLSSSASLEVLVAFIANDLYHLKMKRKEMALLAQKVENEFMGMHCGIMDQLVIACGIKNKALLMNTATLDIEVKDGVFDGYQWIIMNTNYKRKTTDSKYNQRRSECDEALSIIKRDFDVDYLCDLKISDLTKIKSIIKDDILYKRVKHVVSEQDRMFQSKLAMEQHDVSAFAHLLNQSHQSLKEDFEVTGVHLDILCDAARANGALGARVTGAGFGGCAIALVRNSQVKLMEENVRQIYYEKTKLEVEFYEVTFENGVHEENSYAN